MTIKQLLHLQTVAECGSFTSASERLYISQPTLSKSIAQLERNYRIKIFTRKPHGVELTSQGRDFLGYAKNVLNAANNLDKVFSDENSKRQSQLLIASQQLDFLYSTLLKTYEQYKDKDIYWDIIETDRRNVIRHVLDRKATIGIIVRTSSDSKSFQWYTDMTRLDTYTLDQSDTFVCFGPKSPLYERDVITFSEASCCPQIALDLDSDVKSSFSFSYFSHHFNESNLISFNTMSACQQFLLETDALLFISKWTIGCLTDPSIRTIPVAPDISTKGSPSTELLWLKRAGEPLSCIDKQFIQHLYMHLGQPMPEIIL